MCCPSHFIGRSAVDRRQKIITLYDQEEPNDQEFPESERVEATPRSHRLLELEGYERLGLVHRSREDVRREKDPWEILIRRAEADQFKLLKLYESRRQQGGFHWFLHRDTWDMLRIAAWKYIQHCRQRNGDDLTPEEEGELQEIEERRQNRSREELNRLLDALLFVS